MARYSMLFRARAVYHPALIPYAILQGIVPKFIGAFPGKPELLYGATIGAPTGQVQV